MTHSDKIAWINSEEAIDIQVADWIKSYLPKFDTEYKEPLYEYEEVQSYKPGKRQTDKSQAINRLKTLTRDQINDMIKARLIYVMSKVKVLETHFVSGTSGTSERTQATPRKDEFNVISVDIALRYDEHKFLFANPQQLNSSGSDPNHLQQNYIMGFVFPAENTAELRLTEEWYENFFEVFDTLDAENSVRESDMQIDNRNTVVIGIDEALKLTNKRENPSMEATEYKVPKHQSGKIKEQKLLFSEDRFFSDDLPRLANLEAAANLSAVFDDCHNYILRQRRIS